MAMTEEEKKLRRKESNLRWRQNHPEYKKRRNEKRNERRKNDPDWHKKEMEQRRKFYKAHRDDPEWRKRQYYLNKKWCQEHPEVMKKRYKKAMFYNSRPIAGIFSFYYSKNYSRYISLYGYFIVLKAPSESLRRSIMIRLGKGSIDEEEAIRLSGQSLTQEDIDLIDSYDYKRKEKIIRIV